MLALVERPVHAQPVVWAPSLPQRGRRLAVRVKIAEPDSTVIKLLNQVAKAVKQGDILPQRGPPQAPRARPVEPDDILARRGRLLARLAQGALKGGIILPRGQQVPLHAQAVPLESLVTISRWQCLAPRIWW